MLDKIAKAAKTLPGVALAAGAVLVGGAAYALNDDGDQGTVTIEQVASEPTASETVAPAPVVTTSEPAPVVTPEPVASTPAPVVKESTVTKPEPAVVPPPATATEVAEPPVTYDGPPIPPGGGQGAGGINLDG